MKVLNRSTNPHYGDVVAARPTRRGALGGAAASAWVAGLLGSTAIRNSAPAATGSTLTFPEFQRVYEQTHHVAPGYDSAILIK